MSKTSDNEVPPWAVKASLLEPYVWRHDADDAAVARLHHTPHGGEHRASVVWEVKG